MDNRCLWRTAIDTEHSDPAAAISQVSQSISKGGAWEGCTVHCAVGGNWRGMLLGTSGVRRWHGGFPPPSSMGRYFTSISGVFHEYFK